MELTEDLEWAYKLEKETIKHGHLTIENRNNESVFEKLYSPGSQIQLIQHIHPTGVLSKLNPTYSGVCKVLEVDCLYLTLRERDTQRSFISKHDTVSAASLSQLDN